MYAYPRDSIIYLVRRVSNCHYVEDEMKKSFKRYFTQQGRYSSEYFKGSVTEMAQCIDQLIDKLGQSVEEEGIAEKLNKYYSDRHRINIDNVVDVTEDDSDSSDSSDSSETECISLDSGVSGDENVLSESNDGSDDDEQCNNENENDTNTGSRKFSCIDCGKYL